jgi:nitric oxide dioxygenase
VKYCVFYGTNNRMLTSQQIALVKSSWRMLRGIEPAIMAGAFYAKLFADHPALKRMFPKDMEPQYIKLMAMLHSMVVHLDKLDIMAADIDAMAKRHTGYCVKPKHYAMIGEALLWTLEKGLGKDWTPAVAEAWNTCYQHLAETMIAAAAGAPTGQTNFWRSQPFYFH